MVAVTLETSIVSLVLVDADRGDLFVAASVGLAPQGGERPAHDAAFGRRPEQLPRGAGPCWSRTSRPTGASGA